MSICYNSELFFSKYNIDKTKLRRRYCIKMFRFLKRRGFELSKDVFDYLNWSLCPKRRSKYKNSLHCYFSKISFFWDIIVTLLLRTWGIFFSLLGLKSKRTNRLKFFGFVQTEIRTIIGIDHVETCAKILPTRVW